MPKSTQRTLIMVWLRWFLVLYGFQWLATSRLGLMRPDLAVSWSRIETMATSNRGKIYLLERFMNRQVAWDSEYYVGIAVGGYDDPAAGTISSTASGEPVIKNYSFWGAIELLTVPGPWPACSCWACRRCCLLLTCGLAS